MSSPPSTSRQTTGKTSKWLPISAFIGTSLALAIPLFMLRRQRILFNNLKTPPPPRRSNNATTISPSLASLDGGTTTSAFPSTSKQGLEATSDPSDLSSSPGMLSAMSQINQSSAFLAAKAFLIATGLVAVGGVAFTWAVKTTLGVENAQEFGQKIRSIFRTTVPGLRSRLYRPPETDDERYEIQTQEIGAIQGDWNWEEAEQRLNKAYEEGGIAAWAQIALRELEAETEVERTKRDQELEVDLASGK